MSVIGIDAGGTFTDVVYYDMHGGDVKTLKVPSTPRNPADAVIAGIRATGGNGIDYIVHGTTVATNAMLERTGAKVALLTSEGFRDVLEIGTTQRMDESGSFSPKIVRPPTLIPRPLRLEVAERLGPEGDILIALDEAGLESASKALRALGGIEAVAICFLHAYRNPAHEIRAAELIRTAYPDLFLSYSSEVLAEHREFRRFATTSVNAYVGPVMRHYLTTLSARLADEATGATLVCTGSNGGVLSPAYAARFPVRTILSGPVGGVAASIEVTRQVGCTDMLTYDMGGTSTDVALINDLRVNTTSESMIAGLPIALPQADIKTVGAGGGSIAYVNHGRLYVGPRSAGAVPGPAGYQLGGTEPTITDANLVLGRLDDGQVLGGAIELNRVLAERAITAIAGSLGLPTVRVAEGIVKLGVAKAASAIREVSVLRGFDARDFPILAYGGAGPLHAADVAEELGCRRVIVPRHPGNFAAFGGLLADLRYDYSQTYLCTLQNVSERDLKRSFRSLEEAGRAQLRRDGIGRVERISTIWSAAVRYRNQGYDLSVPLEYGNCSPDYIGRCFSRTYERMYGGGRVASAIELVAIRVSVIGEVVRPPLRSSFGVASEPLLKTRPVYFDGAFLTTPFFDRDRLPAGMSLRGPAVILESGATTIIPPSWLATIDQFGNLHLEH